MSGLTREAMLELLANAGLEGEDAIESLCVLADKMRDKERVVPLLEQAFGSDAVRAAAIVLVAFGLEGEAIAYELEHGG